MLTSLIFKLNTLRKQNPVNKNASLRELFLRLHTDGNGNYTTFRTTEAGFLPILVVDARINDKNEIELFERIP